MPAKKNLNLLPKDEFDYSTLGKIVNWTLSIGRWVIVFTLLIVICAFLSRFYFDTVNSILFDEIYQKQSILASTGTFEEEFKQLQIKTQLIKSILSKTKTPSTLLAEIGKLTPLDLTLEQVSVEQKGITLTGHSLSENGLKVFLNGIKNHPSVDTVTLSNFSQKDPLFGTKFTIGASFKND